MSGHARSHRQWWSDWYDWPPGALAACDDIEDQHPRWFPVWHPGSDRGGFRHCGYYAVRRDIVDAEASLHAETPVAALAGGSGDVVVDEDVSDFPAHVLAQLAALGDLPLYAEALARAVEADPRVDCCPPAGFDLRLS